MTRGEAPDHWFEPIAAHQLQSYPHGFRRPRRNRLGGRQCNWFDIFCGNDSVDEPGMVSALGIELIAEHEELEGALMSHQPGRE